MPLPFELVESLPMYDGFSPAADAGGRTSAWVNLVNAAKAYIVAFINQGNAATILLSPLQATSAAGAGSKAVSSARIWANQDGTTAPLVRQTDAATFTTSAAVKDKIIVFEINPTEHLDQPNSFTYVAMSTGASNAANITSCLVFLAGPRFGGVTPPNPLV